MSSLLNQDQLYNREERIAYIYRWLLSNGNLSDIEQNMSNGESFTSEQKDFINSIIEEIEMLTDSIKKFIPSNWSWERYNFIEKSVLINAAAEIIIANNKKAIVIDESVEYAKIYCGDKASPLINGIIDKIEPNK